MKEFFRFGFIGLVIGLSVGYVLADWYDPTDPPPTTSGPGVYNAAAPINVSDNPQTKGTSALSTIFTVNGTLRSAWLEATEKLRIGAGAIADPDPIAALDVDGQIRIRGGNFGAGTPVGKVLTSVDSTGLARWQEPLAGLAKLEEGFGIDLGDYSGAGGALTYAPSTLTSSGVISVWAGQVNPNTNKTSADMIQQRITATPCASPGAITAVAQGGAATCAPFVTTVQANSTSGLILTAAGGPTTAAASGPISLAVNVGAGLLLDPTDNKVKLNINETAGAGDGLTLSGGQLKFELCGANKTWKYDGTKWVCWDFPSPSISMPGESVMYLRRKGDASLDPALCLTASGWNEAPRLTSPSLAYTGNESVSGNYNETRVCYRSDKACQVIYIRSGINPPASCPTSPNVWSDAVGVTSEWGPSNSTNYVRTCYICS